MRAVRYLTFHVLQAFETTLATITSVLCNQALLTSVGVSAEGSIFGAVAVQWIIKDGAGEVAKLFFIRHFSPSCCLRQSRQTRRQNISVYPAEYVSSLRYLPIIAYASPLISVLLTISEV